VGIVAKWELRAEVVAHLRRHPGHSDRRVAELFGVHHVTVGRWRREAELEKFVKKLDGQRRRARVTD
jgi:hypothetical protein